MYPVADNKDCICPNNQQKSSRLLANADTGSPWEIQGAVSPVFHYTQNALFGPYAKNHITVRIFCSSLRHV